ncbi:MAG: ABC transporter permease subunit [Anaerolineales bacterium]|jgi:ABC-2 type transport system permease protein
MASNSEFQPIGNQGRLQGFGNLLRKENRLWWRTSRWWVQTLIWLAIANGILFMVIGIAPKMENPPGQDSNTQVTSGAGDAQESLAILGLTVFLKMAGIAIAIGVVVLAQDTLIGEKQSGTAAWVLSKPASRGAFILSKVISHSFGILITMAVFQGGIAYLLIFLVTGKAFPVLPYAGAVGMLFLSLLFWLALAIMLSALSNSRGLAIGIPLLLILGFTLFVEFAPWVADYMPWNLTSAVSTNQPALAVSLVLGQPIPTWMPLIATVFGYLVFTLIAIWRFQKEEF